ncbi:unnamed protein product [Periconia digitata]|uniref:Uncharacterized protein n=1 Tax=Periconia digitata TaxID=1303443 RepID=A0A9W4UKS4_9PLEO|nr:unnamed protein product [Periconia digitata]
MSSKFRSDLERELDPLGLNVSFPKEPVTVSHHRSAGHIPLPGTGPADHRMTRTERKHEQTAKHSLKVEAHRQAALRENMSSSGTSSQSIPKIGTVQPVKISSFARAKIVDNVGSSAVTGRGGEPSGHEKKPVARGSENPSRRIAHVNRGSPETPQKPTTKSPPTSQKIRSASYKTPLRNVSALPPPKFQLDAQMGHGNAASSSANTSRDPENWDIAQTMALFHIDNKTQDKNVPQATKIALGTSQQKSAVPPHLRRVERKVAEQIDDPFIEKPKIEEPKIEQPKIEKQPPVNIGAKYERYCEAREIMWKEKDLGFKDEHCSEESNLMDMPSASFNLLLKYVRDHHDKRAHDFANAMVKTYGPDKQFNMSNMQHYAGGSP